MAVRLVVCAVFCLGGGVAGHYWCVSLGAIATSIAEMRDINIEWDASKGFVYEATVLDANVRR